MGLFLLVGLDTEDVFEIRFHDVGEFGQTPAKSLGKARVRGHYHAYQREFLGASTRLNSHGYLPRSQNANPPWPR